MNLSDVTNDMIRSALMAALEAVEGADLYNGGPWAIDMRILAEPYVVIYQAANGDTYQRTFTLEIEGEQLNAVLSTTRTAVEARTVWIPLDLATQASFSAGQGYEGHSTKKGLLFRVGDYPDKVPITEDNIRKFVKNFPTGGVTIKSEHESSLIGKAMEEDGAKVLRVWSENADSELHGEVQYPNWLAFALRKLRNCVSIGVNRAVDCLTEVSLVLNPRVDDAAVFHHDAALAFKATSQFTSFAAKHPSEAAKIVTEAERSPAPAEEPMNKAKISERLKAFFAGKTPEQRAAYTDEQIADAIADDNPNPTPPTNFAVDPAIRAEIDALKKKDLERDQTFAAQTDANDAAKFYLEELRAGRATPVEEADVLEQFSLARFKDRTTAAAFSVNADGSAERALRERFAKRPVQFRMGSSLPSEGELVSASPYGVFSAKELGVKEETK